VNGDWRRDRELLRTFERQMTIRRHAPLPVILWNWRKELLILGAVMILGLVVAGTLGPLSLLAVASAMIGLFWPPWPEQFSELFWQIVTPHLLRSGLYHAGIQNRNGRMPFIVRITREPFGERLRLRCPPGTCAEDLYDAREILRAACRATDVRVMRDERRAHIVTVDVIRRPSGDGTADDGQRELAA
jgi:hypothetical protein